MQRHVGVWLGLALIVVILGLDLVGGGKAELLGRLVGDVRGKGLDAVSGDGGPRRAWAG